MNKLPFIIVENDVDIRLVRLLIIISRLSYSSKKNPILSIEKMAVYDFFLRYPSILYGVTKINNYKQTFELEEYEYNNEESNHHNRGIIYDFELLHKLLQILICYGYIDIINNKETFYIISDEGMIFLNSLDSEYIKRLKELSVVLLQMRSLDFGKMNNLINLIIEGGNVYE